MSYIWFTAHPLDNCRPQVPNPFLCPTKDPFLKFCVLLSLRCFGVGCHHLPPWLLTLVMVLPYKEHCCSPYFSHIVNTVFKLLSVSAPPYPRPLGLPPPIWSTPDPNPPAPVCYSFPHQCPPSPPVLPLNVVPSAVVEWHISCFITCMLPQFIQCWWV